MGGNSRNQKPISAEFYLGDISDVLRMPCCARRRARRNRKQKWVLWFTAFACEELHRHQSSERSMLVAIQLASSIPPSYTLCTHRRATLINRQKTTDNVQGRISRGFIAIGGFCSGHTPIPRCSFSAIACCSGNARSRWPRCLRQGCAYWPWQFQPPQIDAAQLNTKHVFRRLSSHFCGVCFATHWHLSYEIFIHSDF